MTKSGADGGPSGIDTDALRSWFDALFGGNVALELAPIRGGGSCELFAVTRGDQRWVLRKAPRIAVSDTAHDVLREYAVISVLQQGAVRVPRVHGACDDRAIADAPFYVMDFIDGVVVRRRLPEVYQQAPEQQRCIGEELIDALVELHNFDWRDSELAAMSHHEDYLARQTGRWLKQYEGYACRELPAIDSVAHWLERHLPARHDLTVMHGDYKLDNVMMSRGLPPRILSLVDFEMTTVGDPLIDLAWAMIFWPEEGNLIAIAAPGGDGGMDAGFCQAPQALVQRYVERTARDIADFRWYQAFAAWKLAILLEGSYAKFVAGKSDNPNHEMFGFVADQLLLRAERFAC